MEVESVGRQGVTAPGPVGPLSHVAVTVMSTENESKWTSVTLQRSDVTDLDEYAESRFGHTEVSYRSIIQSLLSEAEE